MKNIPRVKSEAIRDKRVSIGGATLPLGAFPFVITDVVPKWPASTRWTPDYLMTRFGEHEVECFVTSREDPRFLQQSTTTRSMRFADFLSHVFRLSPDNGELMYLRIGAREDLFRELEEEFDIPGLLPGYNPEATGVWLGQAPNLTPFHHDWWHSCLAQVCGSKSFVLIHPFEAGLLEKRWMDSARFDLEPAPRLDPEDPWLGQLETSCTGVLDPGEILYIPPYWWHQIETLDGGNISMPLRFDTSQSPEVSLFQLSQESLLREITNNPISNDHEIRSCLARNRRGFLDLESRFIEALCEVRGVTLDPESLA